MRIILLIAFVLFCFGVIGWLCSPYSPWSGDLIMHDGKLVNRFDISDAHQRVPRSAHQSHRLKVLSKKARRQARRLERTKRKLSALPVPERQKA